MARRPLWAALAAGAAAPTAALDVLFMADIGHAREDADDLTSPWPMDKSAYEGAFSLYDGLRDYVQNQGVRPDALVVAGDVAYSGGSVSVLNATRAAFQRYLMGVVPEDKVFPVIGNHDIHFLGCSAVEERPWQVPCYYGKNYFGLDDKSEPELTYGQWQANWVEYFPGLRLHAIAPPPSSPAAEKKKKTWQVPTRYNLDLDKESRVYIIAGLLSGAGQLARTEDTPLEAMDASADGGDDLQCEFLRDSLAEGKRLGKSIFIYFTHHFEEQCEDWSLISQIDVWIVGHKHNYWQNMRPLSTIKQEGRHYPARILVGNGGFDEGRIDVVSFGHMKEEVFRDGFFGEKRVRLTFLIKDTCVGNDGACPAGTGPYWTHCWKQCQDMPGGYDSGGGPRKATDSRHNFGFTFEAPLQPSTAPPKAPFAGTWKLQLGNESAMFWLGVKDVKAGDASKVALVPVEQEGHAAVVTFYDGDASAGTARVALADAVRGPVVNATGGALVREFGFWSTNVRGDGSIVTQDGFQFTFDTSGGALHMTGVAWVDQGAGPQLVVAEGQRLELRAAAAALPARAPRRQDTSVITV